MKEYDFKRENLRAALLMIANEKILPKSILLIDIIDDLIDILSEDTMLSPKIYEEILPNTSPEKYMQNLEKASEVAKWLADALCNNNEFLEFVQKDSDFCQVFIYFGSETLYKVGPSKGFNLHAILSKLGPFARCNTLLKNL